METSKNHFVPTNDNGSTPLIINANDKHAKKAVKFFNENPSISPDKLLHMFLNGSSLSDLSAHYSGNIKRVRYAINLAYYHPDCADYRDQVFDYAEKCLFAKNGTYSSIKKNMYQKFGINNYNLENLLKYKYPSYFTLFKDKYDSIVESVVKDKLSRLSTKSISDKYGVSISAVSKILKSNGLNPIDLIHDVHKQIVDLAIEGKLYNEISSIVGRSVTYVKTVINNAINNKYPGISIPSDLKLNCKCEKKIRNISIISDAVDKCMTPDQLSQKYGVSKCLIYQILSDSGNRYDNKRVERDSAICKLFLNGIPTDTIASTYGITKEWVLSIVKKNNISPKDINNRNNMIYKSVLTGVPISEVSSLYSVPEDIIRQIYNTYYARHHKVNKRSKSYPVQDIISDINSGKMSRVDIAKKYDINPFSLSRIIHNAQTDGVIPLSSCGLNSPYIKSKHDAIAERNASIIFDLENGVPVKEAANIYGLSPQYINYIKNRHQQTKDSITEHS